MPVHKARIVSVIWRQYSSASSSGITFTGGPGWKGKDDLHYIPPCNKTFTGYPGHNNDHAMPDIQQYVTLTLLKLTPCATYFVLEQ